MSNTCQIRKYLAIALALTLSAGLLIGCTRSDRSTQNAQNVSGTTTQTQQGGSVSSSAGSAEIQNTPVENVQENVQEDAQEDALEAFTGEFVKSDGTESVRLTLENDHLVSFVFQESGINGSAAVDGSTALYHGDDSYTITFDAAGGMLVVTVDGDDAQQSPMNGIYYRDPGENDQEDDDAAYDADETED